MGSAKNNSQSKSGRRISYFLVVSYYERLTQQTSYTNKYPTYTRLCYTVESEREYRKSK